MAEQKKDKPAKKEFDKVAVRDASRGMINMLVSEATAKGENETALRAEIAKKFPGADVDETVKEIKRFGWKLTKPD